MTNPVFADFGIRRWSLVSLCLSVIAMTLLVACTSESTLATRSPAAVPEGASSLDLRTAPPATRDVENWACPDAVLGPVRVLLDGNTVAFEWVFDGSAAELTWPRGFSAWLRSGRAEVVAPDGTIIARDQETIADELGGDAASICRVKGILYPPAG